MKYRIELTVSYELDFPNETGLWDGQGTHVTTAGALSCGGSQACYDSVSQLAREICGIISEFGVPKVTFGAEPA